MTYPFRLCPKALWAKQSIKLIGMGCQAFDEVVAGMVAVTQKMSGMYRLGSFSTWMPEHHNEHFLLSFSNQYLTATQLANGESPCTIDPTIDPHGFLQQATSMFDGIHLEDNCVLYYEWLCKDRWVLTRDMPHTDSLADLQLQHVRIYQSWPAGRETWSNRPAAVHSRNRRHVS